MSVHSLNLHPRYAARWGAWEIAREVISNALDAAPDDCVFRCTSADRLVVTTPTVPRLAEMIILGCGTKDGTTDTIGQFGEGLKLAALACTRGGGVFKVRTPDSYVRFEFREQLGEEVLHAVVTKAAHTEGFRIVIEMPGIREAMAGKIRKDSQPGYWRCNKNDRPRLYCRGIYICELSHSDGLFHYNLNELTINRDRDVPSSWSVKHAAGDLIMRSMTPALAKQLMLKRNSWETRDAVEYVVGDHKDTDAVAVPMMADAIAELRGENWILASGNHKLDAAARRKGHVVVDNIPVSLGQYMASIAGVGHVSDVVSQQETMHEVKDARDRYTRQLAEIDRLFDFLGMVSTVSIKVFRAEGNVTIYGKAFIGSKQVWLQDSLFQCEGLSVELIRTALHEYAHIASKAGDETHTFEQTMDLIMGKLGMWWLQSTRL
jgi:hypothetical protein